MSIPERWRVELTRPAERDIRGLDRPVRERVLIAIEGLTGDWPAGDIKRMSGVTPPQWRLRSATGACGSTATQRPARF